MSFDNPVTQGSKLVIDAIQSPNYVLGSTGWTINKDGSAEFNNVAVRGTLNVVGSDPDAFIKIITIGGIPVIQFSDQNGYTYQIQATDFGAVGGDQTLQIGPDAAGTAQIYVSPNDGIVLASSGKDVLFENSTGFLKSSNGVPATVENWKDLTLPVGWGEDQPCQYKLFPDGMVRCRGIINATPNPIPGGTVIFTLPAGYRPPQVCYFDAVFDASATRGRFLVRTNGNVELYEAPNDLPDLGSIAFDVNAT